MGDYFQNEDLIKEDKKRYREIAEEVSKVDGFKRVLAITGKQFGKEFNDDPKTFKLYHIIHDPTNSVSVRKGDYRPHMNGNYNPPNIYPEPTKAARCHRDN